MHPNDPSLHDAYAADYDREVLAAGCYLAEVLFGLSFEDLPPGGRVLDLGIGSGLAAALFLKAGFRVDGMDFSTAMLAICRAKGVGLELIQHDLLNLPWPFPAGLYDGLVCCGVFHFLADLEGVFNEARRVLSSEGIFVFTSKSPRGASLARRNYAAHPVGDFEIIEHQPEYLDALLKRAGFERLKRLRCFVGEDLFYAWSARVKQEPAARGIDSG